MKRLIPLVALAAAVLLAAPALADRRHHDGYRDGGHRHGAHCDHGRYDRYDRHDRRHGHRYGKRHGYQPFQGGYYDRGWQQHKRRYYRPRHDDYVYYDGYRRHRHDHRAVAWIEPRYRHAWRWCEHHGGWFRIGDFLIVY